MNFRVEWRRALREQCGRDVEQKVALPVSQIKEGIAKLPFKEELSLVNLVPQVRVQRLSVEHVTVPQFGEEGAEVVGRLLN